MFLKAVLSFITISVRYLRRGQQNTRLHGATGIQTAAAIRTTATVGRIRPNLPQPFTELTLFTALAAGPRP